MNRMLAIVKNLGKNDHGVTAIEYGLIAALVAVAIITSTTLLGTNIASRFNQAAVAIGAA